MKSLVEMTLKLIRSLYITKYISFLFRHHYLATVSKYFRYNVTVCRNFENAAMSRANVITINYFSKAPTHIHTRWQRIQWHVRMKLKWYAYTTRYREQRQHVLHIYESCFCRGFADITVIGAESLARRYIRHILGFVSSPWYPRWLDFGTKIIYYRITNWTSLSRRDYLVENS